MARLRLLGVAIAVVLAISVVSCARCYGSRKVEVPRLAGQIVDSRTKKPIAGMAVYQRYGTYNTMMAGTHEGGGQRDIRWVITDSEGRFEFPAHVVAEALKNYVHIDSTPAMLLLHRDYGRPLVYVPENREQWESIVWEVEPESVSLEWLKTGDLCSVVCDLSGAAYAHCFEYACGRPLPPGRRGP